MWLRGGEVSAAFPAGKGGCVGAVGRFSRGAMAGHGALSAVKWAARLCASAALWRLSRALSASQLAEAVVLLKQRRALRANGLFAPVAVLGSGEAKRGRVASGAEGKVIR